MTVSPPPAVSDPNPTAVTRRTVPLCAEGVACVSATFREEAQSSAPVWEETQKNLPPLMLPAMQT